MGGVTVAAPRVIGQLMNELRESLVEPKLTNCTINDAAAAAWKLAKLAKTTPAHWQNWQIGKTRKRPAKCTASSVSGTFGLVRQC